MNQVRSFLPNPSRTSLWLKWTLPALFLGPLLSMTPPARVTAQAEIPQATAAARIQQREQQVRQVRPENYDLAAYPVIDKNEKHWKFLLWTTAVVHPQEAFVGETISRILALTTQPRLSDPQKRTVDMAMQVGTQLYLSNPNLYDNIAQQLLQTIDRSSDPQWVAMALSALANPASNQKADRKALSSAVQQLRDRVRQRFPNWSGNVFLQTTLRDLDRIYAPSALPPLKDLLTWEIAPKQIHVYVLCRPNREVLCQTVVKNKQGEFVRQNGELWTVPLLLRSLHNLSWNFQRGATPQGIFRMEGMEEQPDLKFFRAFGQFPLVNLFVPFESGVKSFVPGQSGTLKNLEGYQALLPSSWRGYWPIQQTYWAGRSGRTEFRIHGTGESPDFFSNKSLSSDSYVWNPTIGCLSALELYDNTGRLVQADMPKIVNLLTQLGGPKFAGYVIVVEIPGSTQRPVSLAEIATAIDG
ncbi:hypothetical protein BST81_14805 [Leptolyngbya sp. 'hensonii']|uniref:hypothetical protein n=1 Tax=Leptolyngbya sp. 'hensonii' TaxID=1922337 RepID=UPI0009500296|nr:hypothetical protein [Leptolyngbya sp. 'hensonii']OLP17592.1 hypothetical protein BST81_14805 [Leptolyngbya sp. 'hensonii']